MNQDESPADAFDAKLNRLFAEKNESLPANEFVSQVLPRLERAHRVRQLRRLLLVAVLLVAAAFMAPIVTQMTVKIFSVAGSITLTPAMGVIAGVSMLVVTLGVLVWSRNQV